MGAVLSAWTWIFLGFIFKNKRYSFYDWTYHIALLCLCIYFSCDYVVLRGLKIKWKIMTSKFQNLFCKITITYICPSIPFSCARLSFILLSIKHLHLYFLCFFLRKRWHRRTTTKCNDWAAALYKYYQPNMLC